MNFELTPQMIDKIAFAMEDQKQRFAVDIESGELVPWPETAVEGPEERQVPLPRWGSAEGFHLMESFITSLDNPAYREQLSQALTMGKGVFRAFKDALKQNKEMERIWFAYKERRLQGVIVSWYNTNREARGLARLPVELEEANRRGGWRSAMPRKGRDFPRQGRRAHPSCSRRPRPRIWRALRGG